MRKSASVLIRRFLLSLKPRQIFCRKELRGFGNTGEVDCCLQRMVENREIIRLIKGIYILRQSDGWIPTPEEVAKIKARSMDRIISEQPKQTAHKLGLIESDEKTLTFNTTGRPISFKYQGVTIIFKEATSRKINLCDTRIGKAINVLWYLGPDFPQELAELIVKKYLHTAERQQLRQELSGMPEWLLERMKKLLPDYLPFGYPAYDPDYFETEESQFDLKGEGDLHSFQKFMQETTAAMDHYSGVMKKFEVNLEREKKSF